MSGVVRRKSGFKFSTFVYHVSADKTKNFIGISETLIATSVAGVIFSLSSGQPLLIVGTTGPLLLFDEALYNVRLLKYNSFSSVSTQARVSAESS